MTADVMAPEVRRIRAFFAPTDRVAQQATIFDPAQAGRFPIDTPPSPWIDLGWISEFKRECGTTILPIRTGTPASTQMQVRSEVEAKVSFSFESWGKLQLSLAAGTQQMNLLPTQTGAMRTGSGGAALSAAALLSGATATTLPLSATDAASFQVGGLVAVDVDYQAPGVGPVGSGVTGAYVKAALTDVDYVRRVTLNVGRIRAIANGVLTLEAPLLAGVPAVGMKVSPVVGFCDREGSSFFQEWSALFVAEGQQGERILWHYPRLQAMGGIAEVAAKSAGGYEAMRLSGAFRALPVTDPVDGERVVCFRSYLAS